MSEPPRFLPCGAWPSPLTPARVAAGAVALGFPTATNGALYWVEGRPAEAGRSVLVSWRPGGDVAEPLDAAADVRSRVHEYGGTPYAVVGDRIVYAHYADQQLRLHRPGAAASVLTPPGCRYADFCAAPDGRTLLAVREDHRGGGEPVNAVVALDLDAGTDPGSSPAADSGRVLFGGSDFVAWPRLSADGRRLALVAWDHPAMPWDTTRLVVCELDADGAVVSQEVVAGGPGVAVGEPVWAADGSLYFLSDRRGWSNLYRWRSGGVEPVLEIDAEIGGPLWQLGQSSHAALPDGRMLLRISRAAVDTLALLDPQTGALHTLDLPHVAFGAIGVQGTGTAYAIGATVDRPPELIAIDLPSGGWQAVRRAAPPPLAPEFVSHPQAISYPTVPGPDGSAREAHAWYYPPHHPDCLPLPGEKPPLMTLLHGGPTSHSGPAFKAGVQFWTTRGFAVVDVNYGGSSGYGRDYRDRLRGEWGRVDLQDAIAAVDHLVALGLVDGQRAAMRGGSAGGYTVLSALAFSDRFAAGINYFGVADLESLAADTHKFESRYLDTLVAPLPAGREVYRARSPAFHMDGCRGALLTLQGSDDRAVPPQQSRDIVAAARAAGCAVTYLEFEGEGHGFRQAKHIVRGLEAELVFLGRVFGYVPADELPEIEIANAAALGGRR